MSKDITLIEDSQIYHQLKQNNASTLIFIQQNLTPSQIENLCQLSQIQQLKENVASTHKTNVQHLQIKSFQPKIIRY